MKHIIGCKCEGAGEHVRVHQEKVQLILCPFATWLFLHYSAFFCFYLFLLLFLSLILKKVEKGLQKVLKPSQVLLQLTTNVVTVV